MSSGKAPRCTEAIHESSARGRNPFFGSKNWLQLAHCRTIWAQSGDITSTVGTWLTLVRLQTMWFFRSVRSTDLLTVSIWGAQCGMFEGQGFKMLEKATKEEINAQEQLDSFFVRFKKKHQIFQAGLLPSRSRWFFSCLKFSTDLLWSKDGLDLQDTLEGFTPLHWAVLSDNPKADPFFRKNRGFAQFWYFYVFLVLNSRSNQFKI